MNSNWLKTLFIWLVLFFSVVVIANYIAASGKTLEISFSEFMNEVDKGHVKRVVIEGHNVKGELKVPVKLNGMSYTRFKTRIPFDDPELVKTLVKKGVEVDSKARKLYWDILIGNLPWIILLLVFWFFLMGKMGAGPRDAIRFGKSSVKILKETKPKVTFDDVAGCEEAKEELREVIDFLKNPEKYKRIGARIPKGVLLVGPPGTGKTLLARAVAGEAEVPFLSISGSEFVELFVGIGAARVRDLFEQAKANSPCIVFIDEIDAVGRLRGAGLGGGHDEREQTLNQLLVEMDGFDASEGIVVMAATNRPDILDPALLRPGRFDRQIVVPVPDIKGREQILKIHARNVPLAEDVDFSIIARQTPGFTGADLANLVNEAALLAARENSEKVYMRHFEEAKDKIIMGVARKSAVIEEDDKERIAYHEAGHAIVSKNLKHADPVHKVTIIPHGRALGVTQQLPERDRYLYSKEYLLDQITVLLGGRAAEKLVYKTESTGAASDLERATQLARKMVCEWGMSEKVGPVVWGKTEEEVFLGREFGVKKYYSEETAKIIDEEIRKIIERAEKRAMDILKGYRRALDETVKRLLEKEVISGEELEEILRGENGEDNRTA